jgi:hypothetical protein
MKIFQVSLPNCHTQSSYLPGGETLNSPSSNRGAGKVEQISPLSPKRHNHQQQQNYKQPPPPAPRIELEHRTPEFLPNELQTGFRENLIVPNNVNLAR